MATYKVIQDIEAEDKLFGPFSFRQFVYLIIVIVSLVLGYKLATIAWFLPFLLIPHTFFFALLAAPFGHDQSSEVWLLAKIRFALKPRIRIWDQTGASNLVTITVPKKIEKHLTNNLTQLEVRSRLEALASTIDSRGWAIKDVDVNLFSQPTLAMAGVGADSDRLIAPGAFPQEVGVDEIHASDDIFESTNTTNQYIDQMMNASSQSHREQIVAQMKQSAAQPAAPAPAATGGQPQVPPPDYWFLNANAGDPAATAPGQATFPSTGIIAPTTNSAGPAQPAVTPMNTPVNVPSGPTPSVTPDEQALLAQLHATEETRPTNVWNHMRTIKTLEEQEAEAATKAAQATMTPPMSQAPEPPMTPAPDPAILELGYACPRG